jgi:hypothetical protein
MFLFIFIFTGISYAQDEQVLQPTGYTLISSEDMPHVNDALRTPIKQLLPDAKEVYLEYDSPEAREYIDKLGLGFIPYVIFDRSIALNDKFFHMVKNNMINQLKGYYVIPDEQLQMGEIMILDRQKQPDSLSIFVMSFCPYAREALASLIDFIRRNDIKIDIRIRYIVNYNEFGIDSLRGPEEIRENLRQISIQDKYPDRFFDYLLLIQNKTPEDALRELDIPQAEIENNRENALSQLRIDFDEKEALGIKRSPTFLLDNVYLIPTIDNLSRHKPFDVKKKP